MQDTGTGRGTDGYNGRKGSETARMRERERERLREGEIEIEIER